MEKRHCICSGLWFPDSLTANCVPGSREVACEITQCWGGKTLSHTVGGLRWEVEKLCVLSSHMEPQSSKDPAMLSAPWDTGAVQWPGPGCSPASPWIG